MINIEKITESELEVLNVLWEKHPRTSKEICEITSIKRDWEPSTIKTLIARLVKKGIIIGKKEVVYMYTPLITREEYQKNKASLFVKKIFGGSKKKLIANLLGNDSITKEEIGEIMIMLKERIDD